VAGAVPNLPLNHFNPEVHPGQPRHPSGPSHRGF
jgi:hypothetical protein